MTGVDIPFVVCVSADVSVRERVVRQLDDLGPVVICADLAELRAMLFPGPALPAAALPGPALPAAAPPGSVRCGDLVVDPAGHLVTWRGSRWR